MLGKIGEVSQHEGFALAGRQPAQRGHRRTLLLSHQGVGFRRGSVRHGQGLGARLARRMADRQPFTTETRRYPST